MLATLEVVMSIAVVFVGLPSGVYNLIANRHFHPPGRSWFAKCYRAERYLFFAHNLLLLVIVPKPSSGSACISAMWMEAWARPSRSGPVWPSP